MTGWCPYGKACRPRFWRGTARRTPNNADNCPRPRCPARNEVPLRMKSIKAFLHETRDYISSPRLRSNGHQGCRPLPRSGSATMTPQGPARRRRAQLSKLAPARAPRRSCGPITRTEFSADQSPQQADFILLTNHLNRSPHAQRMGGVKSGD